MHTLYDILKKGNIGIIESPTGTVSVTNFITMQGKTLSLLCGSLTWLKSVSTLPDDFIREGTQENQELQSDVSGLPSWLLDIRDEDIALSL